MPGEFTQRETFDPESPERRENAGPARGSAFAIFITIGAGSTGLNLQEVDTVLNVDLPWNPAVLEQHIARAHRMGQERPVQSYVLVTENATEEIRKARVEREAAEAAAQRESSPESQERARVLGERLPQSSERGPDGRLCLTVALPDESALDVLAGSSATNVRRVDRRPLRGDPGYPREFRKVKNPRTEQRGVGRGGYFRRALRPRMTLS